MPGTLTPGQVFDHSQIELSGRSLMYPLDFAAAIKSGETVYEGGVMTLNADGEFVAGLGDSVANEAVDGKAPMAIFAIQSSDAYDANSDIGNISGGVMSGLVATGGYEIQTTQYVSASYVPNELLSFGLTSNRGKVTKAAAKYSDEHVIGVVSRANGVNEYNKAVLSFWTVFCPAIHPTATT